MSKNIKINQNKNDSKTSVNLKKAFPFPKRTSNYKGSEKWNPKTYRPYILK